MLIASAVGLVTLITSSLAPSAVARPTSAPVFRINSEDLHTLVSTATLSRRQCDVCFLSGGGSSSPYGSNINPYNPFANGYPSTNHDNTPAPAPDPAPAPAPAPSPNDGSGDTTTPATPSPTPTPATVTPTPGASYEFKNQTYGIMDTNWRFTAEVDGFPQGVATFAGTLPTEYAAFTDVWYTNAPKGFGIFNPPVENVVAMYLVGSTKSDRGSFGFALYDNSTGVGNITFSAFGSAAGDASSKLGILYGIEGLDPTLTIPNQLVVLKGDDSTDYLAFQGVVITTRTETSSTGGEVSVVEDTDLLNTVDGTTATVTTMADGPSQPYTSSSPAASTTPAAGIASTPSTPASSPASAPASVPTTVGSGQQAVVPSAATFTHASLSALVLAASVSALVLFF